MAESFSHKWGQIIGNLLQDFICARLEEVAKDRDLYLDYQRKRSARAGKKVSWKDCYGNSHDLDYVLELGGTEDKIGEPAAFIETAWRRYTKHSKNKAQEIEGALVPLAKTYSNINPFLGVILAGAFTSTAIKQLQSKDFEVICIRYDSIVEAKASIGIDASFDESTPESDFQQKIEQWHNLSDRKIVNLKNKLLSIERSQIENFINALVKTLSRKVESVLVTVLHGKALQLATLSMAIEYIHNYQENQPSPALVSKYELHIRYNNGDIIQAIFQNKTEAIKLLRRFI